MRTGGNLPNTPPVLKAVPRRPKTKPNPEVTQPLSLTPVPNPCFLPATSPQMRAVA